MKVMILELGGRNSGISCSHEHDIKESHLVLYDFVLSDCSIKLLSDFVLLFRLEKVTF